LGGINPSSSIKDALESNGYIIDKNDDNIYITFSELKQILIAADVCKGMSDTAIGKELTKIGLVSDDKKINGKNTKIRRHVHKTNDSLESSYIISDPQV
jgi:hypothetical protein